RLTSLRRTLERRAVAKRQQHSGARATYAWEGLNLGFSNHGLTRLLGGGRPALDAAFERGAGNPDTIAMLNDPPVAEWLPAFRTQPIDGVFLVTGPNRHFVETQGNHL